MRSDEEILQENEDSFPFGGANQDVVDIGPTNISSIPPLLSHGIDDEMSFAQSVHSDDESGITLSSFRESTKYDTSRSTTFSEYGSRSRHIKRKPKESKTKDSSKGTASKERNNQRERPDPEEFKLTVGKAPTTFPVESSSSSNVF